MADEPDNELLLDSSMELQDEREGEPADTDDVTIEIEGEDEPEETPLVKQLRQRGVDLARENAELRRGRQPSEAPKVGAKPKLEDFDYDEDRYDAARDKWEADKRAVADYERQQSEQQQARNHAFERTVANYRGRAAQLGVRDFAEVEQQVMAKVPELLRNAVLQYADDPAKVMYALGKYPARMDKLVAEGDPNAGGDPVRFILGISKLEREMKVVNKRKPPEPEAGTIQRGSAPLAASNVEKERAKLEAEADRTGDRTKIIAFNRAQREKDKK